MVKFDSVTRRLKKVTESRAERHLFVIEDDVNLVQTFQDYLINRRYCPFGPTARSGVDYDLTIVQTLVEAESFIEPLYNRQCRSTTSAGSDNSFELYMVLDNCFRQEPRSHFLGEMWTDFLDLVVDYGNQRGAPFECYSLRNIVIYSDDWHTSHAAANNLDLGEDAHAYGIDCIVDKPDIRRLMNVLNEMVRQPYRHFNRMDLDFD